MVAQPLRAAAANTATAVVRTLILKEPIPYELARTIGRNLRRGEGWADEFTTKPGEAGAGFPRLRRHPGFGAAEDRDP